MSITPRCGTGTGNDLYSEGMRLSTSPVETTSFRQKVIVVSAVGLKQSA